MSGDRVSVVIPAYNAAKTIGVALDSVRGQSLRVGEIVVVDDGSGDETATIVRDRYADCRFVERTSNGGPAAARNDGLRHSSGEWIAFLDGDDAWLPWRLDVQLRLAERSPDVAVWCGATTGLNHEAPDAGAAPDAETVSTRVIPLDEFVRHNPVATSTALVKRRVLEEVGGFDEAFRGPEDLDLWLRIAAANEIRRIDAPLARYRQAVGSLSMDDRTFLPQVLRVLDKAFENGGALSNRPELRLSAESNQYWNASWMAFNRGSRIDAVRLWCKAYARNRKAAHPAQRQWIRLFARYLIGKQEV